jgi:hypothetical protein
MPWRGSSPMAARAPRRRRKPPRRRHRRQRGRQRRADRNHPVRRQDGVAETLAKDAVFVSSATMDPDVARRLAKQLEATGRHYLDAPISGGAQRAAQGELTILASGSPAALPRRGRRSMRWRQNSTNSAMPQARAPRSR